MARFVAKSFHVISLLMMHTFCLTSSKHSHRGYVRAIKGMFSRKVGKNLSKIKQKWPIDPSSVEFIDMFTGIATACGSWSITESATPIARSGALWRTLLQPVPETELLCVKG